MYILLKKTGGTLISNSTGVCTLLPKIWDTEISYDDKVELAYMLFITKQMGYILKHHHKLDDDWIVSPISDYLDLYNSVHDELTKKSMAYYRFAPIINFNIKADAVGIDRKILSLDDLLSDYNWVQAMVKKHKLLAEAIYHDNKHNYEEAEEMGKKVVGRFSK